MKKIIALFATMSALCVEAQTHYYNHDNDLTVVKRCVLASHSDQHVDNFVRYDRMSVTDKNFWIRSGDTLDYQMAAYTSYDSVCVIQYENTIPIECASRHMQSRGFALASPYQLVGYVHTYLLRNPGPFIAVGAISPDEFCYVERDCYGVITAGTWFRQAIGPSAEEGVGYENIFFVGLK